MGVPCRRAGQVLSGHFARLHVTALSAAEYHIRLPAAPIIFHHLALCYHIPLGAANRRGFADHQHGQRDQFAKSVAKGCAELKPFHLMCPPFLNLPVLSRLRVLWNQTRSLAEPTRYSSLRS
jgi:hypothetical protein